MTFSSSQYLFLQQPHEDVRDSSVLNTTTKLKGFQQTGKQMCIQSLAHSVLFLNRLHPSIHPAINCLGITSCTSSSIRQDRAVDQDGGHSLLRPQIVGSAYSSFSVNERTVQAQQALFVSTPPPTPSIPLRSEFPWGSSGYA